MAADTTSIEKHKLTSYLLDAQTKVVGLFEKIERDFIHLGIGKKMLSKEIHKLGAKLIGSGPNTPMPYAKNLPDRAIQPDNVLFVDLSRFRDKPDMAGEELYDIACEQAKQAGWEFGGQITGDLVGSCPHERIPNDKITPYITKGNKERLNSEGQKRHCILSCRLRSPDGYSKDS
ncbi:hypothetical protein AOQ84DRAFT_394752 [Glonium stellatum]|uniref:Uncharacterized protein n=1 Tax=Glonium stellatum TaxID=574774 RepID=A0A8E2FBN2_9PEZI|nr:hypothetical protein AOQ84DRAFT_394752 [Glonium stellatum]